MKDLETGNGSKHPDEHPKQIRKVQQEDQTNITLRQNTNNALQQQNQASIVLEQNQSKDQTVEAEGCNRGITWEAALVETRTFEGNPEVFRIHGLFRAHTC